MHHILVCKVTLIAAAVTCARGIWIFFLASVLFSPFFFSRKTPSGRDLSSTRMWHLNWDDYLLGGQWFPRGAAVGGQAGAAWAQHCGAARGDSDQCSPRCCLAALTSAQSWEISWGPQGKWAKKNHVIPLCSTTKLFLFLYFSLSARPVMLCSIWIQRKGCQK